MRKRSLVVIAVLALSVVPAADASGFRCGTSLITNGDLKARVLAECGEPTWVERIYDAVIVERGGIFWPLAVDEEWIYNLGPQEFVRILRFRDGRVVDIGHGDYGWNQSNRTAR
ncbi:MAG: DUF2845 domain-containing protein [bacterium]